eukprot:14775849-Alexandrium_andersonii.AAC.1
MHASFTKAVRSLSGKDAAPRARRSQGQPVFKDVDVLAAARCTVLRDHDNHDAVVVARAAAQWGKQANRLTAFAGGVA